MAGLLGSIPSEDKNLALMLTGLGLLGGNYGRNQNEAFTNALQTGSQMGMMGLNQAVQNQRAQQQFGLQERQVKNAEETSALTRKQLEASIAQNDWMRNMQRGILERAGVVAPGAQGMPQPGAMGGAPSPMQSAPRPSTPAGEGSALGLGLDQIGGMAIAGIPGAGTLVDIAKLRQPNIKYEGGIPVDMRTAQPVANGLIIPQVNQQGFATTPTIGPNGQVSIGVTPGAPQAYGTQLGIAEGVKAATSPYPGGRVLPDGSRVPMSTAAALGLPGAGGLPGSPAPGGAPVIEQSPTAKAQDTKIGTDLAERQTELFKAAGTAPFRRAKYQELVGLLGDFEGGKLSGTSMELSRLGNSLGFQVGNLPNREAAASLAREMALELRNPSAGGGMPGALSNSDREYLTSITPNDAQSASGRRKIASARIAMADREELAGTFAQRYVEKYGRLDEGFFSQLRQYNMQNPIFGKR